MNTTLDNMLDIHNNAKLQKRVETFASMILHDSQYLYSCRQVLANNEHSKLDGLREDLDEEIFDEYGRRVIFLQTNLEQLKSKLSNLEQKLLSLLNARDALILKVRHASMSTTSFKRCNAYCARCQEFSSKGYTTSPDFNPLHSSSTVNHNIQYERF